MILIFEQAIECVYRLCCVIQSKRGNAPFFNIYVPNSKSYIIYYLEGTYGEKILDRK